MVLPENKYAIICLNLPPVEKLDLQICELLREKLLNHWWNSTLSKNCKNSNYKKLFLSFKDGPGVKEPITDPNRFHCEELLKVHRYVRPKKPLLKVVKKAPTTTKNLLQYVMKGAEDMARIFGGKETKIIYSSLLVSTPGGANQAFHEDVLDSYERNQMVYAMIISLCDDTSVDVDLGRNQVISVSIPSGYAMIFDAKELTHRGVGYEKWNCRIYLKFGINDLKKTATGGSEVVSWDTCPDCKARLFVKLATHKKRCVRYYMKKDKLSEEAAKDRVQDNIVSDSNKYATYEKKRKAERIAEKKKNLKKM